MRYAVPVAVLLFVDVALSDDVAPAAMQDKTALQGLWQAEKLESNGEAAPAAATKAFRIRIEGNELVFNPSAENRKHTFSIDPAAEPKAMNLTPADGPGKGQNLPCAIYKLDDNKLVLCIAKAGKADKRPSKFATTAGDGIALITLKRVEEVK